MPLQKDVLSPFSTAPTLLGTNYLELMLAAVGSGKLQT